MKLQDYVPKRTTSVPPGEMRENILGRRSMLAMAMLLLLMWCVPQRAMAADANQISIVFCNDTWYVFRGIGPQH